MPNSIRNCIGEKATVFPRAHFLSWSSRPHRTCQFISRNRYAASLDTAYTLALSLLPTGMYIHSHWEFRKRNFLSSLDSTSCILRSCQQFTSRANFMHVNRRIQLRVPHRIQSSYYTNLCRQLINLGWATLTNKYLRSTRETEQPVSLHRSVGLSKSKRAYPLHGQHLVF
jgi:hypothetical protein